ncbi:MAG: ABC transporter permease [Myxococcota bacterium]
MRASSLAAVVTKEVRQTLRDKRMMALLLVAPTIQLCVFTVAVDLEIDAIDTAIVDLDDTQESRREIAALVADGMLSDAGRHRSVDTAMHALVDGNVSAVLVFDRGFARVRGRGEGTAVQMIYDGSDPNKGTAAASAARAAFGGTSASPVAVLYLNNPSLDTAPYMIPALSGVILLLVTMIVAAMGLARESERGTLEQISVTPLTRGEFLLGKLLPFAAVGVFDFLLALAVGGALFGLPLTQPLGPVFVVLPIFLVASLSLGLLVANVSANQQQAFITGFLVMLPLILLSGALTPLSSMPAWLQQLTWANPMRHFAALTRAFLLRGASLSEVWRELLALLVCALAFFSAALLSFRKIKE